MPSAQGASIPLANPRWQVATTSASSNEGVETPAEFSCASETDPVPGVDNDVVVKTADPRTSNESDSSVAAAADPTAANAHDRCASERSAELLLPDFPLLPVSRGFILTLSKLLDQYLSVLDAAADRTDGDAACDPDR